MKASTTTIILTACFISLLLALFGCAKQNAKKSLIGTWKVSGYSLVFNGCFGSDYYADNNGDFGTITFDNRGKLETDYSLKGDTCSSPYESHNSSGKWKVVSHDRKLLTLHYYKVEMNEENWDCLFGIAEKAGQQNQVTLQKGGLYDFVTEYIYLERMSD